MSEEVTPLTKPLDEVTLTFYFFGSSSYLPLSFDKVRQEIELQAKDAVNVKLDFRWISSTSFNNEIKTLISSGETFDAFEVMRFNEIKGWDCLLDISKIFPQNAPVLFSKFSGEEIEQASYNGKIVAVPRCVPNSNRICATVNEDLMKKYNIPEIKTYNDFEFYMKTLKQNETKYEPMYTSHGTIDLFAEYYGYTQFMGNIVYRWEDTEMKLIPWEQTPEFRQAYDTLKRWQLYGYMNTPYEINTYFGGPILFLESMNFASGLVNNRRLRLGVNSKLFPLYFDRIASRAPVQMSIAFNKNAANPGRTMMFLEWVHSSQKNYDLFMYGQEGKDYQLQDQRIKLLDTYIPYAWWYGSEAFEDIDYIRPAITAPKGYKEQFKKIFTQGTQYPPHTGFVLDNEELKTMIDGRNSVFVKMENSIRNKTFIWTADSFITQQKEAGVDGLVSVLQKKLDEWRAANNK